MSTDYVGLSVRRGPPTPGTAGNVRPSVCVSPARLHLDTPFS